MNNQEMDTPTITSLVVGNEPPNHHTSKPARPWITPFLELLGLLGIIDNSRPTPRVDDQRFCFQPSHDFSEISRIFLSVSTPNLQYDIDLKTIRNVGSDLVPPAATKLKEYANSILQRNKQFRDRLIQRDLLKDPTCFLRVDMFTCPLCLEPLRGCFECDSAVACSSLACAASHDVDCEQCFEHSRMVCFACLKKNDTVPPLICCPTCRSWCCREDSYWCAGLVVEPTLGSKELAELSRECEWDSETIVRSHPPKPSPCKFCTDSEVPPDWATCRNATTDMDPDRCPSQTPFMTDHGLLAAHCYGCIQFTPGWHCACGIAWLCDMCLEVGNKSIDYPLLITCPRCGVSYCTGDDPPCGNYIDICRGCKGVILCQDCEEEEDLPRDTETQQGLPKRVVFTEQCSLCEAWSCGDCASKRTMRCLDCGTWYCYKCITDPEYDIVHQCLSCGGLVCKTCRLRHQEGCARPTMVWAMARPPPLNYV
ncbi:hypothetical protein OG21DRAFT_1511536 [Imleria badia]|nr:hypothetical protein OG21DRAFT_1511536 [Imleria badia]